MNRLKTVILVTLLSAHVIAQSCTGDLEWETSASICIPTCTAHYYPDKELCPTRTIGRCACPEGLIKLEDTSDECVNALSEECQEATKKYMDDPSSQFKFSKEPEDLTVHVGDSVTLTCLVSNKYTIQYIWYKLDELPQGDSTAEKNLYMTGTSELIFKDIGPEEAGFYQCKAVADSKFMMISGVGEVKVKHFSTGDTLVSDQRTTLYNPIVQIKCADISANPIPDIRWYFSGENVELKNVSSYFMNRNKGSSDYGSLYIQNVQEEHVGNYTCYGTSSELDKTVKLAERNLIITGSQNTVSGAPKVLEIANHGDKKKTGREGVMYCAGYGYPAPSIKWNKIATIGHYQPEISGCTKSHCVSQGGRRLTIYNLQEDDFGDYKCDVTNTKGDHVTKILAMTQAPESYDVKFDSISSPVKIMPNRYTGFTLTCVVDISLNSGTYMGWYQNTQGIADKGDRIRINTTTRDGKSVQKLIFDYPTNDDHGVFQCLAYNSRTFRQASTDVFVYMGRGVGKDYDIESDFAGEMYDPNTVKEYKYFSELKTAGAAEATCKQWRTDAHLASILNYKENNLVFDILMDNKDETNETRAWIGLTDETKEGIWQWLSGEVSERFCFWWKNHPDNSERNRDYAYMDVAKSGHWLDGDSRMELPFVCKHYNATCLDLETQTELDIDFQQYLHRRQTSRISVYDRASVECGDEEAVLVCAPSGKWALSERSTCSQIDAVIGGKSSGLGLSYRTTSILLILSYLLT